MNDNGPIVFYLSRLDDAELAESLAWAMYCYENAPRFCGWLVDALQAEQTRRVRASLGEQLETDLLTIPCHRWSALEIQQALTLVTVLSYALKEFRVGELVDALVRALVAAAGARLVRLEERCRR